MTKPLISRKNQKYRITLLRSMLWSKVHFRGDCKFNLFGFSRNHYVQHQNGESLNSKVHKSFKFGGGVVMVLGMFSAAGLRPLLQLHDRMAANVYEDLFLNQHVIDVLQTSRNQTAIFTQENAPSHTAKWVKQFQTVQF